MAMKRNIYNNEYRSQKNMPFSPPDMTEKAQTGVSKASGVQRVSMTSWKMLGGKVAMASVEHISAGILD